MSTEAEGKIIELLTEMRDAQRAEVEYRRRVMDESMALQKRGIRFQRIGLLVVLVFVVIALFLVALLSVTK
ncbi:MAG: hypothetical protein ACRC8S_02180 [Fimbriiglobus sp.]